jgi:hypothetical protein
MKHRGMAVVAAALALASAPPGALAWGPHGHRIVCLIAYQLLEPDVQARVDHLTKTFLPPGHASTADAPMYASFPDACTFADTARDNARAGLPAWLYFKRFEEWHFLNLPRDVRTADPDQCGNNCVLRGIAYHSARLANADLQDWKRAEALFFLGHWIGDIHQPLHVSYKDDLGGNRIKPITGGFFTTSSNLHTVWDSGIIEMAHAGNDKTLAAKLAAAITPQMRTEWVAVDPIGWAQESYDITISPDVSYCAWTTTNNPHDEEACVPKSKAGRTLHKSYETEFRPTVERRLQQAGVRLADRIRRALGS